MTKYGSDYFREYVEQFSTYTDLEIVAAFNDQVGNAGPGIAKAAYLSAIRHEFDRRNIDESIIRKGDTCYPKKVSLYYLDKKKVIKPIE